MEEASLARTLLGLTEKDANCLYYKYGKSNERGRGVTYLWGRAGRNEPSQLNVYYYCCGMYAVSIVSESTRPSCASQARTISDSRIYFRAGFLSKDENRNEEKRYMYVRHAVRAPHGAAAYWFCKNRPESSRSGGGGMQGRLDEGKDFLRRRTSVSFFPLVLGCWWSGIDMAHRVLVVFSAWLHMCR